MIRKLRRKFIFASMLSVTIVVLILMLSINLGNAIRVDHSADEVLSLLAENEGTLPPMNEVRPRPDGHRFSPETPFETRFFSVLLDENNTPIRVNTVHIAAVTKEKALSYAVGALEDGDDSGYVDIYKYRVLNTKNGRLLLFLDRGRELSTLTSFFLTSLYLSLISLAAIFILLLLLSRRVIRPIAESYERQTQFITDASHELKTPLTIIDANAEVLELENGENEWTASIKNQVSRLASLTDSLTTLCRIGETQHAGPAVDFSLSDTVAEALEPFNAPAALKGKQLQTVIEPDITLHGDERAIRQLVSLLADNAIKYASDDGTIVFSLKKQGKHAVLTCCNPVDAMAPGNYDRLFERFYRADPSRSSATGGSGIGLSIAKAIVTSMGGHITAYSEDGKSLHISACF